MSKEQMILQMTEWAIGHGYHPFSSAVSREEKNQKLRDAAFEVTENSKKWRNK